MTYTVVALIRRKEGIKPAEFRSHYDNVHVPLLKSLVGSTFLLSHTRNYVTRIPTGDPLNSTDSQHDESAANLDFAPVLYEGQASDLNYDSLTVMVWEDKAAFDEFSRIVSTKEVFDKMSEDNKNFLDTTFRLVYAVEEPVITNRD
ncbi:hypothetical protein DL766_009164 [Monosporascus sp. MC13-8B]|uniref:EthD domain-containing protein n=1 Tax=Monosporascus cannonballus TaxID=155416 RepID=A0ABY0H8S8_9PEZI|nr:hypothetical protein DL763_008747 [Monosporascus cannonballus]RYO87743.1 hypothetical protein DL762_004136 [Monosporascus cannonballus]RYP16318.1 hypothetical protein DL766_009164 [Monosporascus sp. MC13-8B]